MAEYIRIDGIDECLRAFNGLERDLRRNANGELRAASKQIATALIPLLGGSTAPQERAMVVAAGPKSDRYVVLAVPNRKPKLSGVSRTPAATAKTLVFAIEGGSDEPQFHGPTRGSIAAQHRAAMARFAIPRYTAAVAAIIRKWGLL